MKLRIWVVWLSIVYVAIRANPCSYGFYPNNYLVDGNGERALAMPEAEFLAELSAHFQAPKEIQMSDAPWARREQKTVAAQEAELSEVLEQYNLNEASQSTVKREYASFVKDMRRPVLRTRSLRWYDGAVRLEEVPPETFIPTDLDSFPALNAILPEEFSLYLRGAACYHTERYVEAIEHWEKLLELPEELRRYRSTWAAYMLGRAWQKQGSSKAAACFQMARDLSRDGFKDALDLARSSLGWQALCENQYGDHAAALKHYLELFASGDPFERHDAYQSMKMVCWNVFDAEGVTAVAADPVARRVVSLWLISGGADPKKSADWLAALNEAAPDSPPVDAGRMAWLAYQGGEMDLAGAWVEKSAPEDFAARWVESKLLMRSGKLEAAEAILHALNMEEQPDYALETPDGFSPGSTRPQRRVAGDLAVMLFNQGQFEAALGSFIQGNYMEDSTFVGEGVLRADEHQSAIVRFVGVAPAEPTDGFRDDLQASQERFLRWNLAQRLNREGHYEEAIPFYPADVGVNRVAGGAKWPHKLADAGRLLLEATSQAKNTKLARAERGEWLLQAADLSRLNVDSLYGWGYVPSHTYYKALEFSNEVLKMRKDGVTDQVKERIEENSPKPGNRPYNARHYIVSDLYWQAAALLPDNDPRTARALWQGGKWIAAKDPDGADKFYKALVKRCPQLPVGQEADRLRWFPQRPEAWKEWSSH